MAPTTRCPEERDRQHPSAGIGIHACDACIARLSFAEIVRISLGSQFLADHPVRDPQGGADPARKRTLDEVLPVDKKNRITRCGVRVALDRLGVSLKRPRAFPWPRACASGPPRWKRPRDRAQGRLRVPGGTARHPWHCAGAVVERGSRATPSSPDEHALPPRWLRLRTQAPGARCASRFQVASRGISSSESKSCGRRTVRLPTFLHTGARGSRVVVACRLPPSPECATIRPAPGPGLIAAQESQDSRLRRQPPSGAGAALRRPSFSACRSWNRRSRCGISTSSAPARSSRRASLSERWSIQRSPLPPRRPGGVTPPSLAGAGHANARRASTRGCEGP